MLPCRLVCFAEIKLASAERSPIATAKQSQHSGTSVLSCSEGLCLAGLRLPLAPVPVPRSQRGSTFPMIKKVVYKVHEQEAWP